ncbi:MAG: ABC transporter permease [Acidimicrobiales bacterium]
MVASSEQVRPTPVSIGGIEAPRSSAGSEPPFEPRRQRRPAWLRSAWLVRVAIVVALLGLWQILAITAFKGRGIVPTPVAVARAIVADHGYGSDIEVTLWEALRGFLIGNVAATALAMACLLVPWLRRPARLIGTLTYATPTIAIAPFLVVLMSPDSVKVAMAGFSVFFVTLTTTVAGLDSVPASMLDVTRAVGGSRRTEIIKLRIPSSLEALAGGFALSAPAAILGAILGEYLGGTKGLGVLLLSSQQMLDFSRTWGVAIVATALSAAAFMAFRALARLRAVDFGAIGAAIPVRRPGIARQLASPFLALGAVVVFWQAAIVGLHLNPYLARTPWATLRYLSRGAKAAAHRQELLHGVLVTLGDSGLGWVCGSLAALLLAAGLVLLPSVGAAVMPGVLIARSVPLVAMIPLLTLLFGRGLLGVTVIAAIVVFAPSVVLLVEGLSSTPQAGIDLMRGLGSGRTATLRRVQLPFALPSVLAAARISIPGAVLGAVLAEWLVTGRGIGHLLSYAIATSDYGMIWAAIAAVGLLSVLVIEVFTIAEELVVARRAQR